MKLLNTIDLFPGCPGAWTHPNGKGVHLRFPTTGRQPDHGRMIVDFTIAVDWAFERNESLFHVICQARADVAGWDTGYYRGHGPIFGKLLSPDDQPRGKIESWGPHYNPSGPGGNFILPQSNSPIMLGNTIYRGRLVSTRTPAGFKSIGYALWQPNQVPTFDTGDCEDDNMDVDIESEALLLAVHFEPKPGVTDPGIVRLSNVHVNHTSDCTPMPDLRRLWSPS